MNMNRPRKGWIKTIRTALCMTPSQLGERMGISRSTVYQLQRAEEEYSISFRSMKKAAEAMECEFVYWFVPRKSDD